MSQRERMCRNKTQFSEHAAWDKAKRNRKHGDPCHAYHCWHCGFWHIGWDAALTREYSEGREE